MRSRLGRTGAGTGLSAVLPAGPPRLASGAARAGQWAAERAHTAPRRRCTKAVGRDSRGPRA
eukprot:10091022-Alexandrium_andersonii.AAC.1